MKPQKPSPGADTELASDWYNYGLAVGAKISADRIEALEAALDKMAADSDVELTQLTHAVADNIRKIEALEAVARLSEDLLIELDIYWSGTSGPSLSGIMLDWRNKYRILLEDGGVAQGSGSRDEIRNAALEEAASYHDTEAATCRAIALCNRDNDLGVDSETHAIDHEIAAKDIREMKT